MALIESYEYHANLYANQINPYDNKQTREVDSASSASSASSAWQQEKKEKEKVIGKLIASLTLV